MKRVITDKEYYELCKISYDDKILSIGNNIKLQSGTKEISWKVINSIDNDKSGLQGAALIPSEEYEDVKTGKNQPSKMVFVSRGTENLTDWSCNISDLGTYPKPSVLRKIENSKIIKINRTLIKSSAVMPKFLKTYYIGATTTKDNQFAEYDDFVKNTINKYKPKDYSFTGHSLGGALAQYEAVINNKIGVTYSAAKAYRLLPKEFQEKVRRGEYKNQIFNYKHRGDPVGYVPLGELIGTQLFVKSNVDKIRITYGIDQHMLNSFSGVFNSGGSIRLLVKSEEIFDGVNKLKKNIEYYNGIIREIENRMNTLDEETYKIYRKFSAKMGSEEYKYLTQSDLDKIFDEIVPYKPDRFYDRLKSEEIIYYIRLEINKLIELISNIEDGVKKMQEGDLDIASLF